MTVAAVGRATALVAFLTVVSRVFGFGREASLAAVFGATQGVDAYLMSQTIPLLFVGIISNALKTTFIPIYSQVLSDSGESGAFQLANTVLRATLILGLLLIGFGELLAEPLMRLVAPGFDHGSIELAAYLSRIIFPTIIFQLMSGVIGGMLQTAGRFGIPEVAGLVQNISIICATLFFGHRFGIKAVAVGLLLGVVGSFIVKLPALRRIGFTWSSTFDIHNAALKQMLLLSLPAIVGAGAGQLNVLVDRILASGLPEGRVAALNYAVRLNSLAPGIIGSSIITVMYPALARYAAQRNWQEFFHSLVRSVSVIHFLMAPLAVAIAVLRKPLVVIVFGRGAFDLIAVEETAWALLFLSVGMAFTSMQSLVGRAFFALKDTLTPTYIGLGAVAVNVIANLLLIGPLEQGGLALGSSISAIMGLIVSLMVIQRKSPHGYSIKDLSISGFRTLAAAATMGAFIWLFYPFVDSLWQGEGPYIELATVAFVSLAGGVVYAVSAWVLKIPEFRLARVFLKDLVSRFNPFAHTR